MDNLWLKVENIEAKGEMACFEQFLLLSLCFLKAVCCRWGQKASIWGKGLRRYVNNFWLKLDVKSHECKHNIENHTVIIRKTAVFVSKLLEQTQAIH